MDQVGEHAHQPLVERARMATARTRAWLVAQQHDDGHWCAELEGDTILESEYILLLSYLGRHESEVARKAARYIVEKQLRDGGWALYPDGKVEISASVKAYFALKLTGHDPASEPMRRARRAILAHGGADAVNSFTRFYLALLGQVPYEICPEVPPELVLLPKWFPVHLYALSAWTRTIVVPLAIMSANRPLARIDPRLGIRELFHRDPKDWPELRCPGKSAAQGMFTWDRFFRMVDRALKLARRCHVLPRKRAVAAAAAWMIERFDDSDGLGAIFPPMVWAVIALRSLGYDDDSPELRYCYERLDGLIIEEGGTVRLQPCKSPVWDTAIALRAVVESGLDAHDPSAASASRWLLDREIRRLGDWVEAVAAEPSGWCFEYANAFYPDVDDTIMVIMALGEQLGSESAATGCATAPRCATAPSGAVRPAIQAETCQHITQGQEATGNGQVRSDVPAESGAHCSYGSSGTARSGAARSGADQSDGTVRDMSDHLARTTAALGRAERWVLAMQNRDGGWGAFDRDNNREFLCHVPFADHNAMIDPSTPDLAGRVLEALASRGRRVGDAAVDRAVAYLRRTQEPDGSWFGRWGVNYIYGTWQVLTGLCAVGVNRDDPAVAAAVAWLLRYQQPDGGWGESCDSYADPSLRGRGATTASQTAWAVLGLLAAGMADHAATRRGIEWLARTQNDDGSWDEAEFTGTGFPLVFYLRYHMYRIYFPLLALARWTKAACDGQREVNSEPDELMAFERETSVAQ